MDVMEAIRNRRSVRAYAETPIPAEVMGRMRQALRYAPSACNNQPWRFILVEDAAVREEVATAAKNQRWMAKAPVIVVACGMPDRAYQHMGGHGNSVEIDLAIAVDHLTLAAVAEGLGTCWIGAFSEEQVKRVLGVPDDVKVVALTPLGYPASPDLIAPVAEARRKTEAELFSTDRYPANG